MRRLPDRREEARAEVEKSRQELEETQAAVVETRKLLMDYWNRHGIDYSAWLNSEPN